MKKLSLRNLTSVLLAGALVLGGSIAMSASADAAGKQGTACTTLKAKSGSYTCIANPLKSSPKNTWANANCVAAQADYLSNVANLATYTKNASNATSLGARPKDGSPKRSRSGADIIASYWPN